MNKAKSLLIEKLSGWKRDIEKFKPPSAQKFELNSKTLNDISKINRLVNQIESIVGSCIYRILIPSKKYCSLIKREFDNFQLDNKPKEKGKKRHVSRFMQCDSICLYVGSKRNKIVNRIKQHLGYGPARTYSLDLKFWFPPNIQILFEIYSVDLGNDLLVILEQQMWENSKPMFGKQSGL